MLSEPEPNTKVSNGIDDEVEEVWQNQSYIPFRGWGKPFSLMKEYTDRSGTTLSNDLFPSFPLLDGWEWVTDWSVDLFGSFGAVDKDGWCYAVTWDGILESVQQNRTVGENSPSHLCRRKRWMRIRKCISEKASEIVNHKMEEKLDVMVSLEKTLHDKTIDYEHLMEYEQQRQGIYTQITTTCLADILSAHQSLLQHRSALTLLKQCLGEQAAMEREYAQKLSAHASKYCSLSHLTGNGISGPAASSTPLQSTSVTVYNSIGDAPPVQSPVVTERSGSADGAVAQQDNNQENQSVQPVDDICSQFFSTLNKYNSIGAQKWSGFSELIESSALEAVDEMLSQLNSQCDVTKKFVYWSDISAAPILTKLESSVVLLQQTYFASANKIKTKMENLDAKLFSGDPSTAASPGGVADGGVAGSTAVRAGRRSSLNQRRSSIGLSSPSLPSQSFPLQASSSGTKVKSDLDSVTDMWTCMKAYRKHVISLGNEVTMLRMAAEQCVAKEVEYGRAVRHIFISSGQVLSHEKARVCVEMGEVVEQERSLFAAQVLEQQKREQQQDKSDEEGVGSGDIKNLSGSSLSVTPALELPKFRNQILLMSIMQYSTLAEARRISLLEHDSTSSGGGGSEVVNKEGLVSTKAVVTTDGVLHVFLLEDKSGSDKKSGGEDVPYRSLLLDNCKIVRHFAENETDREAGGGKKNHLSDSFANAVEIHPRGGGSEWFGSSKKNEALMLIPIDSVESEKWAEVLTSPLCGAEMLYSALGGGGGGSAGTHRSSAVSPPTSSAVSPPTSSTSMVSDIVTAETLSDSATALSDDIADSTIATRNEVSGNQPTNNMSSLFPSI